MKPRLKNKIRILLVFILIASYLFTVDLINWRDSLLIIVSPIVIYHLLLIYVTRVSKSKTAAMLRRMRDDLSNLNCSLTKYKYRYDTVHLDEMVKQMDELIKKLE